MAGLGITLFTDEMVYRDLASALRRLEYDAMSSHEADRVGQGISDEEQLAYATQQGRAILTRDVEDYTRLAAAWRRRGREHAGIIVFSRTQGLSDLLHRTVEHLDTTDPATQYDSVLFI